MRNVSLAVASSRSSAVAFDEARLSRLVRELTVAFSATNRDDLMRWATGSAGDFLRFGANRITRLGKLLRQGAATLGIVTIESYVAYRQERFQSFARDTGLQAAKTVGSWVHSGVTTVAELVAQLGSNPAEAAPRLLTTVLVSLVVSGGPDGDGGVPDLDITLAGIGNHRSILSHSIITGAVLETALFSLIRLVQLIYDKLPTNHDYWWDVAKHQADGILNAARQGTSLGLAYHLLVDGLVQPASYKDLPVDDLPLGVHQTIFTANGLAEAVNGVQPAKFRTVASARAADAQAAFRGQRVLQAFATIRPARHFLAHVREHYDNLAWEERSDNAYVVIYRTPDGAPITDYRRGLPISEEEVGFLEYHYLHWAELSELARAVNRPREEIEAWFIENELRWNSYHSLPQYLVSEEDCLAVKKEIQHNRMTSKSLLALADTTIFDRDSIMYQGENTSHSLDDLEHQEHLGLFRLMYQHNHYVEAARLANLVREDGTTLLPPFDAFTLARQGGSMEQALAALQRMEGDFPECLLEAREALTSYLREELIVELSAFFEEWESQAEARKNGSSETLLFDDVFDRTPILVDRLSVAMNCPIETWHPDLKALHQFLQCGWPRFGDIPEHMPKLGLWVYADKLRYGAQFTKSLPNDKLAALISKICNEKLSEKKAYIEEVLEDYTPDFHSLVQILRKELPCNPQAANRIRASQKGGQSGLLSFEPSESEE